MKSLMTITVAVLCCTLSGCEANTRIAMPWTYWEHGFLAVIGGLVVCYVVVLGLASFGISTEEFNRRQEYTTAWGWGIVAWVGAGFILQILPHTTNGIQFIPLFPWVYADWLSRIVSIACWSSIAISVLLACGSTKANWDTAVGVIMLAFGLNALLSFSGPSNDAVPQAAKEQSSPMKDKIAEWEKLKTEQSDMLQKLLSDKEMLITRIKSLGLRTKQDLMDHRVGRPLVEEYEQLSLQISKCRIEVEALEAVVENANSKMRIFERQQMLHQSTDEEYKQMSETGHELEAELRRRMGDVTPASDVHRDRLLDELLQN